MRGREESQSVTNTKSINLRATDSIRAAARREDEKHGEMAEQAAQSCDGARHVASMWGLRNGGRGKSVQMETKTEDVKREMCKIQHCHNISLKRRIRFKVSTLDKSGWCVCWSAGRKSISSVTQQALPSMAPSVLHAHHIHMCILYILTVESVQCLGLNSTRYLRLIDGINMQRERWLPVGRIRFFFSRSHKPRRRASPCLVAAQAAGLIATRTWLREQGRRAWVDTRGASVSYELWSVCFCVSCDADGSVCFWKCQDEMLKVTTVWEWQNACCGIVESGHRKKVTCSCKVTEKRCD